MSLKHIELCKENSMDGWRRYHKIDPNKSIEDLPKEQDIDQLTLFTLQVMKKDAHTKPLLVTSF
jgi:hypothetical protein